MSEEVWDEVYRLKRILADLRHALRDMNTRVSALEDAKATTEQGEAYTARQHTLARRGRS